MLSQKDAKSQFKKYHKERINQFRTEEQEYRHLNTEILKQKFSFRFRR
jgi:hypothetical protein